MTEAEWLAASEPSVLLLKLRQRGVQRKLRLRNVDRRFRLFAVACCRRVWPLLTDVGKQCVETAERFADGQANDEELRQAEKLADSAGPGGAALPARFACDYACAADMAGREVSPVCHVSTNVIAAVFKQQQSGQPLTGFEHGACPEEEKGQVALLRCIIGNPFRPVVFDAKWRSETAVVLAAGIYEARAFDRLPVLADALEEAGCDDTDVLAHCRGDGPHARGCWVVDGVLGKE